MLATMSTVPVTSTSPSPAPRHIVIPRAGGPGVLRVAPCVPRAPGPGEIAIDVRASGVNFADVFCRLGLYEAAPPPPFAPGFEVAGEVAAVGEGVTRWRRGDRVIAVTRFGGYATHLVVREAFAWPLPAAWSFVEGAGFPVVFLTAWYALVECGRLAAGETVVVQSAAGGVGLAACQLARARGAGRVIGTVGSAAKADVARAYGASEVAVSRRYDVWDEVAHSAGGAGVDLVLDAVGGRQLAQAYAALAPAGRLVCYGFAEMMPTGGLRNWPLLAWRWLRMPRFSPLRMVYENRSVTGFNLIHLWHRVALFEAAMRELGELAEAGRIRPLPTTEIPFDNAAEAHRRLQSRESTGKIVLVP